MSTGESGANDKQEGEQLSFSCDVHLRGIRVAVWFSN
jgi:hypothetical protein